jgi:branched-chain amino acid transport system substrate-binding protein
MIKSGKIATAILVLISIALMAELGCQKQKQEIVNIGAILPLTGSAAKYGESGKNGIDLAFKHFSAANPDFAKKIKIIYEDDKADPKVGLTVFNKLTDIEKIVALIGPMPSGVTLALVDKLNEKRTLLVTPTSTAPKLRGISKFLYRTCVSDYAEGSHMAEVVINKFGIKDAGILYISNEYGLGLKQVFSKKFSELGGHVSFEEAYPPDVSDFRNTIQKVKKANAGAIYLIGYKEQKIILKQLKEAGLKTKIFATTMIEDPDVLQTNAAEDIIYTFRALSDPDSNPTVKPFFSDYKLLYGKEPDFYAAANYDAATVVFNAVLKAKEKGLTPADTVRELNLPQGATGPLTFDDRNDVVQPFILKTIKNNKFVVYKD